MLSPKRDPVPEEVVPAMSTVAATERGTSLGEALRRMGGKATLGDVVAATGMPSVEAEAGLKKLLETCRGHLEVSSAGELLYKFDPKLVARDAEPLGARIRKAAWSAFKVGFKIWTAVMLVVYFVVFVVLVIAAMTAGRSSDRDGGFGGDRRSGGFGLGDLFLMHWLLGGSGWRRGGLYYGDAHARRLPKEAQPPFYKKVFAFIFGPEEPRPTRQQKDRSVLRLIRARRGVVTTAELVEHAALSLPEAEEEMGRLTGAYGGDPRVSPKGEVVYAFPDLMKSAHGKVRAREPDPAWLRLEKPRKLTGNSGGSNLVIGGMNGFNLAAGFVIGLAPSLDAARVEALALDPAIFFGLGVVPVVFSSMFFAIPACRALALRRENNARVRRNVRRVLVGLVCARSVGKVRWISLREAAEHALRQLRGSGATAKIVAEEMRTLAAEFGADVETNDDGFRYRFPAVRAAFVEAELVRRGVKLEDWKPGEIVYSTSDSSAEASERDLAAFDRDRAGAELDLSRYLPSPDRIGYREDFDLVVDDPPVRDASRSRYPSSRRLGSRRG